MANAPVKTMRQNGIEVAIWHKVRDGKNRYSLKVKRNYKDSHDNWQETEFFNDNETPTLILLLTRAYAWMGHQSERNVADVAAENTAE